MEKTDDVFANEDLDGTGEWTDPLKMKIFGVGGAGGSIVDRMKLDNLERVEMCVINTDGQALQSSPIAEKWLLGRGVTRGLSAGGEASIGRAAAEADAEGLKELVSGPNLIFIVAGLGGGTGSGAAPVLARLARDAGAVVICFAPMPFCNEGSKRREQAEQSLQELQSICHAVVRLPNDLLLQELDEDATVMEAFDLADRWIFEGIHAIWTMVFKTGMINVDFAGLRSALNVGTGVTLFGTGYGSGTDFVGDALSALERCPLLVLPENRFNRQIQQMILHLSGGPDLSMARVNQVMEYVKETFGCKSSVLIGANIDGASNKSLRITVLGVCAGATEENPVEDENASPPEEGRNALRRVVQPAEINSHKGGRLPEPVIPSQQFEFSFQKEHERRGFFERSDVNKYEGQDLDIPTFIRRGIRIHLK